VVAGAGVIGCAVAHELARRGASVTLVDPRPIGGGATQASAGMLVPYHEAPERGPFLTLAERSLALYDAFIDRLADDSGTRVEYARTGTLEVALNAGAAGTLRARESALRAAGVGCEWLDAALVRAAELSLGPNAAGGLFIPTHGFVAQEAMTDALARAAVLQGAAYLRRAVQRVGRAGGAVAVDTDAGTLDTDRVVVASGSWSGCVRIDGEPPLPVHPVRGQLLRLEWPHAPLARIVWGPRCYLVPRGDRTLLVGATVEEVGFDERATVAGVRDLMDAACELLPDARRAAFAGVRVGLRPAAPDELPIIGRAPANAAVVYATGHYRNGVLLAPVTAHLVADLILDGRQDPILEHFSPARFAR
jgi:glycine oxidase